MTSPDQFKSLLNAIDKDDSWNTGVALRKGEIDINTLYPISSSEGSDADKQKTETFLHRAMRQNSKNVFRTLLAKGASPKIKGYRGTVIEAFMDDLTNPQKDPEFLMGFGWALIEEGNVIPRDFLEAILHSSKLWDQRYNLYLTRLIEHVNKCALLKRHKLPYKNDQHIRD